MITLTSTCDDCGSIESVEVDTTKFAAYKAGGTAKMHFPDGDWTPAHREIIMNNVPRPVQFYLCPMCWLYMEEGDHGPHNPDDGEWASDGPAGDSALRD